MCKCELSYLSYQYHARADNLVSGPHHTDTEPKTRRGGMRLASKTTAPAQPPPPPHHHRTTTAVYGPVLSGWVVGSDVENRLNLNPGV